MIDSTRPSAPFTRFTSALLLSIIVLVCAPTSAHWTGPSADGSLSFWTTLDTTPPTTSITSPLAGSIVTATVPVTAAAADDVAVAGVQFRLDGAPLGTEVTVSPYAVAWNTLGTTDLIVGVAKIAVAATITEGSGFTQRLSVSCPTCTGGDTVSEDRVQSAAGATAATFTFSAAAHYLAQMAAFKASATPAYVQGATNTTNTGTTTLEQAFGSPNSGGNLIVVTLAWQGNSPVSVTDSRGNLYAVATTDYDSVNGQSLAIVYAPNVRAGANTVTMGFGGAAPTMQRLEIHEYSGIVTASPLDVTAMNIDDGTSAADAGTSGSVPTSVIAPAADGNHTLTSVARDAAGNQTTSAAIIVTVNNNGMIPPVISSVGSSAITASGATITWTTNEASDSQVDYGLTTAYGTSSPLNGTLVVAHTVSLSGLTSNTLYHFRVRSRDAAGSMAISGDFTFTPGDGTAPTVSITAPAAAATVSGVTTVTANATDDVGVAGVQFRLDGAPLGAEVTVSPYAAPWNTLGTTDLIVGVAKIAMAATITEGSGFTRRLSVSCPSCTGGDTVSEDRVQSAAGATAATFTFSAAAHYLAQMAAFKASAPPAYVQGATNTTNTGGSTLAQAFGSANTGGNLIVVTLAWQGNAPVSVTDSQGNLYAVATTDYDSVNGQSLSIVYAANARAGANTVTIGFGGAAPTMKRLEIHEYSGIATASPLDVTAMNIADGLTTANNITSGSVPTSVIAPAADGSHALTAVARDAAGNQTTSAAIVVTVNNNDAIPPVISNVGASAITASGATIAWTTNEASDSQVDYGLTTAYGTSSTLNTSSVTAHAVAVSGLTGSTLYHFRVRSRDAAGNLATSGDFTFATATVDTTPPAISMVAVSSITPSSASIGWTTNEASDSQVDYGLTTAYGTSSPLNGTLVVLHAVSLSGLSGSTLYHFRVRSRDAAGNLAISGDFTFTPGDGTAPTVSITAPAAGATVSGVTTVTATASDNVAVAGVQLTLDGANLGAEVTASPYAAAWNTRGATDLIVGVAKIAVVATITEGSGFTRRLSVSCPSCSGGDTVSEDRVQSAAGAAAATFTFGTAAHYLAQMAAFKASATPAYIQGATNTTNIGNTTLDLAFVSPNTGGNLIVVTLAWQGNAPVSVIDSQGNLYAVATTDYDSVNGQSLAIVYAANVRAGANTVTLDFGSTAPTVQRLEIHEYSGIATASPLDVTAMNIDDGTATADAVTSGSVPTSVIAPAADGSHTLTAMARDAAGNQTTSAAIIVTVNNNDAIPPVISTVSSSAITASGATIAWTTNEASDSQIDYGLTTAYGTSSTLNTSSVTAHAVAVSGLTGSTLYHFRVRSRDAAGNLATSGDFTFTTLDATPPAISMVAVSSITSSTATITWTTNEASDSQVDYGLTTAYGTSSILNGTLVVAHTVSLSGLTGSTLYHFRVRSRDAAGNLATSGDFTFTPGAGTAPTVSITAPAAGATVSGVTTVTATASDNVGVVGVQVKLDGANLGAELTATPYTLSWKTQGSADLVFGVAKIAVAATITQGSGFTQRLSVSCPSCTGGDTVSEDRVQSAAGATAATFTFSAAAHYLAQMAAFKASATPAYIQGATNTTNTGTTTLAQAFASATTAGNLIVVAAAWQGNSVVSVTDSQSNAYAVATTAYDAVNGQSLAILYAANARVGATTVTASFGGASPTAQRLEIHEYSGIATTNALDVAAMNIGDGLATTDGITSGSATTTVVPPAANGAHALTAQARDAAGNTTTSAAVTVTVNNAGDTTPPIVSGVAASLITSAGARITWTTNEASDSEVEYGPTTAYGGFSTLNLSPVTAHTTTLGGLTGNTLYHYRARSRDAAGNLGLSGDFTVTTLESTPPSVSITAPAAGASVLGTVTVTANASDNVGVVGVQFQLDGAPLGAEDTSAAPYSVAWNTTTSSAGTHTLTAVARDAAGNRTTSAPVVVTVSNIAQVMLAWDANSEPTLAGYKVYVGTASGVYGAGIDVGNVTSFTVTGLTPGTYFFVVTAYNVNGFESGWSNEVSASR